MGNWLRTRSLRSFDGCERATLGVRLSTSIHAAPEGREGNVWESPDRALTVVGRGRATSNKTHFQFEFVPFQVRDATPLPRSSPRAEAAATTAGSRPRRRRHRRRRSSSSSGRGRATWTWPRAARRSSSARWPTGPAGCSGPRTDSRSVSKKGGEIGVL